MTSTLASSHSTLQKSKSSSSRTKTLTKDLSKIITAEIEITNKSLSRTQTAAQVPSTKENGDEWNESEEEKSENLKFSRGFRADIQVFSLAELCLKSVISNFEATQQLHRISDLPKKLFEKITEQLPVELKLEVAVSTLPGDGIAGKYWQKRCAVLSKTCDASSHGGSWKRTFLEEKLQQELENFPAGSDISELKKLASISKDYIHTLTFRQLPSHINLSEITISLPKLEKLNLCYSALNLGTDYERSKFGMKLEDAISLGRVLETSSISTLILHNNLIDDRIISSFLINSSSSSFSYLSYLDIAHNSVSDVGIKQLISVLHLQSKKLKYLSLRNNLIGENGVKEIGEFLSNSSSLQTFDISLNRLSTGGAISLISSICSNNSLLHVNISSNGISTTDQLENILQNLLQLNSTLQALDLSGNEIQDSVATKLIEALSKENPSKLKLVDLRKTLVSQETINQLQSLLSKKK